MTREEARSRMREASADVEALRAQASVAKVNSGHPDAPQYPAILAAWESAIAELEEAAKEYVAAFGAEGSR